MITLQQLDEAIDLYERCLKEKWGEYKVIENWMNWGLCYFMDFNFNYKMIKDMPTNRQQTYLCDLFVRNNHQQAFYPRIVFLKTLREELIKKGYYD